eukprot:3672697-Rhodomonas_salina.2
MAGIKGTFLAPCQSACTYVTFLLSPFRLPSALPSPSFSPLYAPPPILSTPSALPVLPLLAALFIIFIAVTTLPDSARSIFRSRSGSGGGSKCSGTPTIGRAPPIATVPSPLSPPPMDPTKLSELMLRLNDARLASAQRSASQRPTRRHASTRWL